MQPRPGPGERGTAHALAWSCAWVLLTAGSVRGAAQAGDAREHVAQGGLWFDQGELGRAELEYTRALELDPRCAEAFGGRANVRLASGALDGALADLTRALELDPSFANAWYSRASLHLGRGENEAALADYDRAIELLPSLAHAWSGRGLARYNLEQYERATLDFDRAVELDPALAAAFLNRALACEAQGESERALADYERYLALSDRPFPGLYGRALVRLERGELDLALLDIERAIAAAPESAVAVCARGDVHLARRDLARALADYERSLALDPGLAAAWCGRGRVREARLDPAGAEADYGRALDLDPACAPAHERIARIAAAAGALGEAMTHLRRALRADPGFAQALLERGRIRGELGDFERALPDLDLAVAKLPCAEAFAERGRAHARRGDHASAVADFERALALASEDAAVLVEHATSLTRLGRLDLALAACDKALHVDPLDPRALFARADVRHALGEREPALADYRTAFDLEGDTALDYDGEAYAPEPDDELALERCTRALELDPSCAPALERRGFLRLVRKDLDLASADLTRAVALDEGNSTLHFLVSILARERGDRENEMAALDRAIALDPEYAAAFAARARAQIGGSGAAEESCARALELDPELVSGALTAAILAARKTDLAAMRATRERAFDLLLDDPCARDHLEVVLRADVWGTGDRFQIRGIQDALLELRGLLSQRLDELSWLRLLDAIEAGDGAALKSGCKPGSSIQKDGEGRTLLHFAAQVGEIPAAELLLGGNADVNARSKNGDTPLDYALAQGETAMVEFLRSRGAKSGNEPR